MTALREAVARAIAGADWDAVAANKDAPPELRPMYVTIHWKDFLAEADAAIAAVFGAIREQLDDPAWHQFGMTEKILHGTFVDGWEGALSAVKMTLRQMAATAERTAAAGKGECDHAWQVVSVDDGGMLERCTVCGKHR